MEAPTREAFCHVVQVYPRGGKRKRSEEEEKNEVSRGQHWF